MHNDSDYPVLDCSELSMSPPPLLYQIPPIGLGTRNVESLWSYLQRISDASSLRLIDLLRFYIWKVLLGKRRTSLTFLQRAINNDGFGHKVATLVADAVQHSGIVDMTLGPLCGTKAAIFRSKAARAWCPDCLQSDLIPYERLLWTVEGVNCCSVHKRRLEVVCPHCSAPQRYTSSRTSIVRCSNCYADRIGAGGTSSMKPEPLEFWTSTQIGDAILATFECRRQNYWRSNLNRCVRLRGGIQPFAREIGAMPATVSGWLRDRQMRLHYAQVFSKFVSVGFYDLLTRKIPEHEFKFCEIPVVFSSRFTPSKKRPHVRIETALKIVSRLIQKSEFRVPRRKEIISAAGIHARHALFESNAFASLIQEAKRNERLARCRTRLWKTTTTINDAVRKVQREHRRVTQRRVMDKMQDRGAFALPLARRYYKWLANRLANGGAVPANIKADVSVRYWIGRRQLGIVGSATKRR